jgi:hypothetical protein
MGGIDIVIDDGSHLVSDVVSSLNFLFPHLSEGGIYIIEDLHASYWPGWGGGLRRKRASIEALKTIIDTIHQPYFRAPVKHKYLQIPAGQIKSVNFFDSIAVLQKAQVGPPRYFVSNQG